MFWWSWGVSTRRNSDHTKHLFFIIPLTCNTQAPAFPLQLCHIISAADVVISGFLGFNLFQISVLVYLPFVSSASLRIPPVCVCVCVCCWLASLRKLWTVRKSHISTCLPVSQEWNSVSGNAADSPAGPLSSVAVWIRLDFSLVALSDLFSCGFWTLTYF